MAMWRALLEASLLASFLANAAAKEHVRGDWGQEVLGCRCAGRIVKHGYCNYHFHMGSPEDKPWCRTMYNCGTSSISGAWIYCDPQGVERRRSEDGKLYNAKEFRDYFKKDGRAKWNKAEAYVERRMAKNGKAYTAFQFRDYYIDALGEQGWIAEWAAAAPEARLGSDGKWYSFEDFAKYYGTQKAWEMWAVATTVMGSSKGA